jgi:hypothetical protein
MEAAEELKRKVNHGDTENTEARSKMSAFRITAKARGREENKIKMHLLRVFDDNA